MRRTFCLPSQVWAYWRGWVYSTTNEESSASEPILKPFPPSGPRRPVEGLLSLFGFPSTPASLELLPRSTGWRASRAAALAGAGLLTAVAVGLIPPHAPWVVAALGTGGVLGWRKWRERFTILSFEGNCPKCGEALNVAPGTPLRPIMSVPCEGCHHDPRLTTTPSAEDAGTGDGS